MQVTAAAAPGTTAPLAETQPVEVQPSTEHQLFDYLVEVEKSTGGAGHFSDPSALFGAAMHSLEGMVEQVQDVFGGMNIRPASPGAGAGGSAESVLFGSDQGQQNGAMRAENMGQTLDRAISFMWAAANVSVAVNSVTAATGSVNTLIKQQ